MTARLARVADLAEQVRGVSYGKNDASSTPRSGYVPVLRAGNITADGLRFDDLVFVPAERVSSTQRVRQNDVVIAASSGSLDVVGKAARALTDFEGGFGAFCKVLRPGSEVDAGYFAHFFKTKDYRQRISSLAAGVNINNLRNEHLDDLQMLVPPRPEQRRIATILDLAESLQLKRRAALAKLDMLTQAIFLDMFGDPARNTMRLETASLGELGDWQSGGTPPRTQEEYFNGDVPWFSSGELNDMYLSESNEHVNSRALRETTVRPVPQGALMLGMYDTAALKAAIAAVDCSCNQAIAFATIKETADPIYIYFAVSIGREHFRRLQRGVRQKNLNLTMIRQIRVPLPSLDLQRCFAGHVAAIRHLKARCTNAQAELDSLFASLQHRAFRGEL